MKDTLMGFELPAWKKTVKRKPFSTSKFYLFDGGVARYLQHRKELQFGSTEYGEAFESFIFHEIHTRILTIAHIAKLSHIGAVHQGLR